MYTKVQQTFDRYASSYDARRRIFIPCYDEFYGTVVELLPYSPHETFQVLDLGAGTGLLSAQILNAFPKVDLTLVDFSEQMLKQARERFGELPNVHYRIADYFQSELPRPVDVVVSALSIHHLDDDQKQQVYTRIFESLCPGGLFVQADLVVGESPGVETKFRQAWEAEILSRGATEDEMSGWRERTAQDQCATLSAQLNWLRGIGYSDVECFFKYYNFAVFAGRKPRSTK